MAQKELRTSVPGMGGGGPWSREAPPRVSRGSPWCDTQQGTQQPPQTTEIERLQELKKNP